MTELKDIEVREVSLVDAGANPEANILFFKRKQEEESMAKKETTTEVVKQEELKSDNESHVKNFTEAFKSATDEILAEKENTELKKRVAELEKALTERDAADKAAVEKAAAEKAAADSKALTDMFERLNKRLEEHVEKAENAELAKTAAKYEILGEKSEELVKTFKLAKAAGNFDTLIGLLDKSLAAVEKAGTFSEIGKTGANTQAVSIQKIAHEIQKTEPALTWAQALDKAFQTHPELEY